MELDPSLVDQQELEVVGVISETHDIKSFRLKKTDGKKFSDFYAGQSLVVFIEGDKKFPQCFSITSSATNNFMMQVSVKKSQFDKGSLWFHSLDVGKKIIASVPTGDFKDHDLEDTASRIYLAEGFGITPVLSMVRSNLDQAKPCKMILFYSVQSEEELAFHKYFEVLDRRHAQFKYVPLLLKASDLWCGTHGALSIDLIKKHSTELDQSYIYVSGSLDYIKRVSEELNNINFNKAKIIINNA